MNPRTWIYTPLLLFVSLSIQAQSELDKRNGFKDIQLNSPVDSLKEKVLKKDFLERNEFPASLYEITGTKYQFIGEVKVEEVLVKSYRGLIYQISVTTVKDPRLMKALESIYGKAEYDLKNETYFWKSDSITLKFLKSGKQNLQLLYTSLIVLKKMKSDKDQKVDDIADDF